MTSPSGSSHVYTHGHAEAVLRSHRWRTADNSAAHLLPHLRAGQRLLDVGSGPGTITADLARLVAPGQVLALEVDEQAAALTRAEIERQGVEGVECLVGDVHALDLPDDSVDVAHAHQVLQHVADPVQALRELSRVVRPGGVVAVRDSDYPGFVWHPASPDLDRWLELTVAAARANGGAPDAGRRLLAWAHAAGLHDPIYTTSTWTYADADSREWWAGLWADRVTTTALAEQLLREGRATREDLEGIAAGWRAWAADPDAVFCVVHGELVVHVT